MLYQTRLRLFILSAILMTAHGMILTSSGFAAVPAVYRDRVEPHWFQNNARFWYRNQLADGASEFVVVDAQKGTRERAFDHTRTADALCKVIGQKVTADHLPFDNLDFDAESGAVMLTGGGKSWRLVLATYAVDPIVSTSIKEKPTTTSQPVPIRPTRNRPRRGNPGSDDARGQKSPDGKWVVSISNNNLILRPGDTDEGLPLSEDGKAGDAYSLNQLWWSPDSQYLVALREEAAQEHSIYTVESSPKDQLQPKLRTLHYLKPGDKIAHPRPRLFHVASRKPVPINDELFANPWSIEDLRWAADSTHFTFVYNQRGHQALRILGVNATDGIVRTIVDESSKTFIDYSGKYYCNWINDSELIWMSERDGWNNLYLVDARSGGVKNAITPGDFVVQSIVKVNEQGRQIWFRAGGVRPGQDPYYSHLCRVNFDGSGFTILTEGDGTHVVQWSPDERFLIDSWSRVDLPPVNELRDARTGGLICKLEEADAHEMLSNRGGRWPERFIAKGRDGVTDIHGVIIFPHDYDPAKKYPVVENIYAGPQDFFTPKAFRTKYGHQQQIADRGMIVVQCDGMGTSGRSRAFHDVCWKNLKDAGFADRIAWIKAAAVTHAAMDLNRVGIYGGSAGAQNAMAAVLWHNDFYKVAVADCGCHDNRMDKIWWNEQWMGWPIGPEYAANSNVVNANLLQGKLLLIFGELDDNVDPSSTLQVVNALEKADKDFELVVITGAHHGAAETPYGSRRRLEFLTRHLLGAADQKAR